MTPPPADLRSQVPLAPFTTMGVGGPARWFTEPATIETLQAAMAWAKEHHLPFLLLGGGSNVLFPDEGFPGLIIRPIITGLEVQDADDWVHLRVGAGMVWDDLVARVAAEGWAGISCLSGIPGSVGAAPIQNIGAYGQEIAETLVAVEALDMESLAPERIRARECGFAYRHSIFKGEARSRFAITAIHLRLRKDALEPVGYPDLLKRLQEPATPAAMRRVVLAVRRAKSMVYDRHDLDSHGCGSFFTNPIISRDAYQVFLTREPGKHPQYDAGPSQVKLSAAWLIEQSGYPKGFGEGAIGLSQKHCLAIVNRGGGTALQVRTLAKQIAATVEKRFGIRLQPEPLVLSPE